MGNIKVQCPKCKHSFYANEYVSIICPKCGTIVRRVG